MSGDERKPRTPTEAMTETSKMIARAARECGMEWTPDEARAVLHAALRDAICEFWKEAFLRMMRERPGGDV